MRVTVEMSLYPLATDALEKILSFIDVVQGDKRIEVVVNQMSTQVRGELADRQVGVQKLHDERLRAAGARAATRGASTMSASGGSSP